MFNLFDHDFPYTNFHELNLDWVIKEVKRIGSVVDNIYKNIEEKIEEIIREKLSRIFLDIVYDEETETINFNVNER